MNNLAPYLAHLATLHDHLCPRQILGLRMGLYAGEQLGLSLPQTDKRLFVFVETDGCFADGVLAATGCSLGHRTMRLVDFGKVAATFVDTLTSQALRLAPLPTVREEAERCCPTASSRWHAQLEAYQMMPADRLFSVRPVTLAVSLEAIISRPGLRVLCDQCGEEIMNAREVRMDGRTLCRACAGEAYYALRLPQEVAE